MSGSTGQDKDRAEVTTSPGPSSANNIKISEQEPSKRKPHRRVVKNKGIGKRTKRHAPHPPAIEAENKEEGNNDPDDDKPLSNFAAKNPVVSKAGDEEGQKKLENIIETAELKDPLALKEPEGPTELESEVEVKIKYFDEKENTNDPKAGKQEEIKNTGDPVPVAKEGEPTTPSNDGNKEQKPREDAPLRMSMISDTEPDVEDRGILNLGKTDALAVCAHAASTDNADIPADPPAIKTVVYDPKPIDTAKLPVDVTEGSTQSPSIPAEDPKEPAN